jgi:hypothetical protein
MLWKRERMVWVYETGKEKPQISVSIISRPGSFLGQTRH